MKATWALSAAETSSSGAARAHCRKTGCHRKKTKPSSWFLILNCEFQIISPRDYLSPSRLSLICSINGNSVPIKMSYPNEFNLRWNCLWQLLAERSVTTEMNKAVILTSINPFSTFFFFVLIRVVFLLDTSRSCSEIKYLVITLIDPILFSCHALIRWTALSVWKKKNTFFWEPQIFDLTSSCLHSSWPVWWDCFESAHQEAARRYHWDTEVRSH